MLLKPENIAGPSTEVPLWCDICQIPKKNAIDNFHFLKKFVQTPQQLLFTFCKLVGHDEGNYQSYELKMERTPTYRMEAENWPHDQGVSAVRGGFQGHGR